MAATDIQYGGLDPVLYTPDFSFLKYALDKKTSNYEQGLKQASSAYHKLEKELTDPANVKRRDEYLKNAQTQIQQIASSDLSNIQNVNFAESVFEPMVKDKAFAYDAFHTARIKQELGKMDAWSKSEDPEIRKKFNPEMQAWLSRDLNSLKTGNGDINNYKVNNRSAMAWVDPQEIVDEAVKEKGFKVKQDTAGNGYIVSVEGGPQFTKNYNSFASDILAANPVYQQQLNILGENRQEQIIDNYRTDAKLAPIWANKTDTEIYANYASTSFNEHRNTQKTYLDTLNKNLSSETADITAAMKGPDSDKYVKGAADVAAGNTSTPEAQMFTAITNRATDRNNLKEKLVDLNQEFDQTYGVDPNKSKEKLDNYVKTFASNPKSYFSDLQYKNDVTRFSSIKSASYSRTVKEDRAFVDLTVAKTNAMKAVNDIKDDLHDNALGDAKLQEQIRIDDAKLAMQGKKKVKNSDGSYSIVDGKTGEITPVDVDITQINTTQALDKLRSELELANGEAIHQMNNPAGALSMLESMGMDSQQVGLLRGAFSKYFTGDGKQGALTAQESKALSSAYTTLWTFSKNNPNNTFLDQERANYGKNGLTIDKLPDLLSKAVAGYKPKNKSEVAAMRSVVEYNNQTTKIKERADALDAGRQIVIKELGNNPKFDKMFYSTDGGKTKKIIDKTYVLNNLKQFKNRIYEDVDWGRDPQVKLSDQDLEKIAAGFFDGSINFEHHERLGTGRLSLHNDNVNFDYNGKKYHIYDGANNALAVPMTTADYRAKLKTINERTLIPQFATASPFYNITGGSRDAIRADLSQVTPTNANILQYNGTSDATQVSSTVQNEIRRALKDKDNVMDDGVTLYTSSPLSGGGQAVAITMKSIKGSENSPAPEWAGKTYYFPISPTGASPEVFKVFDNVSQATEFEPYKKKGEKYNLDMFQASGVKAEIMPTQPGANTGKVRLMQKAYDAKTKTYSDTWSQYGDDIVYDLGKTTFAEVKDNIYNSFIYPYVEGTISYQNQVRATSGGAISTPNDLLRSLLK
jgi:hypothetical protein